jgi:hypothetical protein
VVGITCIAVFSGVGTRGAYAAAVAVVVGVHWSVLLGILKLLSAYIRYIIRNCRVMVQQCVSLSVRPLMCLFLPHLVSFSN